MVTHGLVTNKDVSMNICLLLLASLILGSATPAASQQPSAEPSASRSPEVPVGSSVMSVAIDGHPDFTDGSADFETISEALEAASDGDTIALAPGSYREAIVVDKSVTISAGDPAETALVIPAEASCPIEGFDACGVAIIDADATLSGLSVVRRSGTYPGVDPSAIVISGGTPTLQGLVVEGTVEVFGGSMAMIAGNELKGRVRVSGDGTQPLITLNTIPALTIRSGASPTVDNNDLGRLRIADSGGVVRVNSILGAGRSTAGPGGVGVRVARPDGLVITENLIKDHRVGIAVSGATNLSIDSNSLERNRIGLWMDRAAGTEIPGTVFCRNDRAVVVAEGPRPRGIREFCSAGG